MLAREHVAFGLVSSATVAVSAYSATSPIFSYPVIFTSSAVLGALLTDIDSPTSTAGKLFYPIAVLLNKIFGHRKFLHDFGIWTLVFLLSLFTKNPILIGLLFGYISHIFLDGFTVMGIPYFGKNIRFLPKKICVYAQGFGAKIYTYGLCIGVVFLSEFVCKAYFGVGFSDRLVLFLETFN